MTDGSRTVRLFSKAMEVNKFFPVHIKRKSHHGGLFSPARDWLVILCVFFALLMMEFFLAWSFFGKAQTGLSAEDSIVTPSFEHLKTTELKTFVSAYDKRAERSAGN